MSKRKQRMIFTSFACLDLLSDGDKMCKPRPTRSTNASPPLYAKAIQKQTSKATSLHSKSLYAHVFRAHWVHVHWRFHRITAEGFAQLLIQHDLNESSFISFHLAFDGRNQSFLKTFCRI